VVCNFYIKQCNLERTNSGENPPLEGLLGFFNPDQLHHLIRTNCTIYSGPTS
jgi:hypothetical protein